MRNSCMPASAVRSRLERSIRPRYLRWLARQDHKGLQLSEYWRHFCRTCRRQIHPILDSRIAAWILLGAATVGVLFVLTLVTSALGSMVRSAPDLFFGHPRGCSFQNDQQLSAVAFARLTVFQSVAGLFLFAGALLCFLPRSSRVREQFYARDYRSRLRAWKIGVACFATLSGVATVRVLWALDAHVAGVIYGVVSVVSGNLLLYATGVLLMGVRLPWGHSRAVEGIAAAMTSVTFLCIPLVVSVCFGPAILVLSDHLALLGPFGYVNSNLYQVSRFAGNAGIHLVVSCVAALLVAQRIARTTQSLPFRRRLLSGYRSHADFGEHSLPPASSSSVQQELRTVMMERRHLTWRAVLCPGWMRERWWSFALFWGLLFGTQLLFVSFALYITRLQQSAGIASSPESERLNLMIAGACGWSIVLLEGYALLFREQSVLMTFAQRPASLGRLWLGLQRRWLRLMPAQVLCVAPLVAVTLIWAPTARWSAAMLMLAGILGCAAIRTGLAAAACYFPAIDNLPGWRAAVFQTIGALVLAGFVAVTAVASFTAALDDLSTSAFATRLVIIQVVSLVAYPVTWLVWIWLDSPRCDRGEVVAKPT